MLSVDGRSLVAMVTGGIRLKEEGGRGQSVEAGGAHVGKRSGREERKRALLRRELLLVDPDLELTSDDELLRATPSSRSSSSEWTTESGPCQEDNNTVVIYIVMTQEPRMDMIIVSSSEDDATAWNIYMVFTLCPVFLMTKWMVIFAESRDYRAEEN